jgi:hypothetical protein
LGRVRIFLVRRRIGGGDCCCVAILVGVGRSSPPGGGAAGSVRTVKLARSTFFSFSTMGSPHFRGCKEGFSPRDGIGQDVDLHLTAMSAYANEEWPIIGIMPEHDAVSQGCGIQALDGHWTVHCAQVGTRHVRCQ